MTRTRKPPALTEAAFQTQVIQLARLLNWRVAHFRPARTATGWRTPCQADAKGWPDLVMLRANRAIAAELKVGKGKPSVEQVAWLDAFELVPGVEVFLWTPEQWDEIGEVLR